jgi:hypothetical protein
VLERHERAVCGPVRVRVRVRVGVRVRVRARSADLLGLRFG